MIDSLVSQQILNNLYHQTSEIEALRQTFATEQMVRFPDLLQPRVLTALQAEVTRLEAVSVVNRFYSQGANTPRFLRGVGGSTILEQSTLLAALYIHYELWQLVAQIVDAPIYRSSHEQEFIGVNYLLGEGDTQGWHLDDNAYTLIIFTETPPVQMGGAVECIFDWHQQAAPLGWADGHPVAPFVATLRQAGQVTAHSFSSGEAYLLRADKTMHRVTPLAGKGRRTVVGMSYESTATPVYTNLVTGIYDM